MDDIDSDPHFTSQFSSAATPDSTSLNSRSKRTKLIRIMNDHNLTTPSSSGIVKPKNRKKPDPSAPKITRPCSECGKKFWSWKALFGHMRCHPDRQWRGIDPPPDFRRPTCPTESEDNEIAACLIMLANGPNATDQSDTVTETNRREINESETAATGRDMDGAGPSSCRFECSSCKREFRSHQALGGHRARHKNVKSCFAMARTESGFVDTEDDHRHGCLDLNLPPVMEDFDDSSSSGLILDLRLDLK